MTWIDYSSRPPTPEFNPQSGHLANYRRVYQSTETKSGSSDAAQDLDAWLRMYDDLGVQHVVLKARDLTTTFGFRIRNEDVAAFCREHGSRFIGFAGVDVHRGQDAVDEFSHAVTDLGLRGLNMQCFELKLRPDDPAMFPFYEKAIELDVPVNIHCGINFSTHTPMSFGRPEHLDEVMIRYPDLRVCASPPGWPWVAELMGVAWRHRNLSIGVVAVRPRLLAKANSGYEMLLQYGRTLLKDRMIFGSSFPMMLPSDALEEVRGLDLPDTVLDGWTRGNAARFLGIDAAY